MKYGLALHTCTPELGLVIDNFTGDSRCQIWNLGRELATHLHLYLNEFMLPQTWTDLQFIAVAKGPGGFTGTRLGMVTARTLAQQLDIPLFAVSTLAAIAFQHITKIASSFPIIAVQMPAQRGEFFVALYENNLGLTPLLSDQVMTLEQWEKTLKNWGSSCQLLEVNQGENEGGIGETVKSVLQLAYLEKKKGILPHWSDALPYYGQHPVKGY